MHGAAELRRFEVWHELTVEVPAGADEARIWLALPADDEPLQVVAELAAELEPAEAGRLVEVRDQRGNRFLHLTARGVGGRTLRIDSSFLLTRREARHDADPAATRPLRDAERRELAAHLRPSRNVVVDDRVRYLAEDVVGEERNPVRQARRIFDWMLANVSHWTKDPSTMKASGMGSSAHSLDRRHGSGPDLHAAYAALAIAAGLPVRMVHGSFLKAPLDGVDRDQGHHAWIEFWAPELGWIPLDVAVADLFVDDFEPSEANAELVSLAGPDGYRGPDARRVRYYFGNLDARRVTWNRGRDLVLPGARGGPVSALPRAHVEVDGVPRAAGWTRKLTFTEIR